MMTDDRAYSLVNGEEGREIGRGREGGKGIDGERERESEREKPNSNSVKHKKAHTTILYVFVVLPDKTHKHAVVVFELSFPL